MKKKLIVLLLVCFFLISSESVLAWHGSYNYEVTNFTVDKNTNKAIIEGWAILNARANYKNKGDGKVLTGTSNRQSGGLQIKYDNKNYKDSNGNKYVSGYCDYGTMKYKKDGKVISKSKDSGYTYKYALEIYKVDKKGKETKLNIDMDFISVPTSFTYAQSYKNNLTNIAYFWNHPSSPNRSYTACYEDVGFKFSFDMSKLTMSDNVEGYKLYLTVSTGDKLGCTENCSEKFPLNVVSGNFEDGDVYFKNTITKTKILIDVGYPWSDASITSSKKKKILDYYSTEYVIRDIRYDPSGYNWYQISKTSKGEILGWVPSSWIDPASGNSYLVPKKPNLELVESCIPKITNQDTVNEEVTCNGEKIFDGDNVKSCNVETSKNNFYTIKCSEELTTDLKPSTKTVTGLGTGFSYEVDVETKRTCVGTFNYTDFKTAWDKVNKNISNAESGSADYTANVNKKNELENILKDYNSWSSDDYNLNDVTAKLIDNVINEEVVFVEKSGSSNTERGTKTATKTHSLNISGIANPIDFRYEETISKTLQLPEVYFNRSNNSIVKNNCDHCVSLGHNYYISSSIYLKNNNAVSENCSGCTYLNKFTKVVGNFNLDYDYKVVVSKLGQDKTWSLETNDCSLNINSNPLIYRSIDLNNPFLDENERLIGKNWLNSSFDFREIIKSNVWEAEPAYEFNLSINNIKQIKKNNRELGANAYLGFYCSLNNEKNRYMCSFLRDDNYFQKHIIGYDNRY